MKETLVAPVSRLKIMFGRTLGGATVAVLQGILVLLLAFIFGFRIVNWWLLPVGLVAMFFVAIIFTALGTAIATVLDDMHGFQLVINFLIMPLFFLSGALFPLAGLPRAFTIVASLNPLSYGVDAFRGALSTGMHFGWGLNFGVLVGMAVVLLVLGAYLFGKMQV